MYYIRKTIFLTRAEAEVALQQVTNGYAKCVECLIANRRKKDPRHNNDISRGERPAYGMCYICGESVKPDFKVCQKHYEHMVRIATENSQSPARQEARKYWKQLNNLVFGGYISGH